MPSSAKLPDTTLSLIYMFQHFAIGEWVDPEIVAATLRRFGLIDRTDGDGDDGTPDAGRAA